MPGPAMEGLDPAVMSVTAARRFRGMPSTEGEAAGGTPKSGERTGFGTKPKSALYTSQNFT